MKDGKFIIHINERYYWDLDLIPSLNECEEPVNRCSLVDSETQKEIHAVNFDSTWFVPIFQCRSQIGMKELATKLKSITDVLGFSVTPRHEMPENKRIKKTEKIVKKIIKKEE